MADAPRRATYEDLVAVSDLLFAEIVDGELVTSREAGLPARPSRLLLGR